MTEKYIKASECEKYFYEHLDDNGMIGAMNAIDEMPATDVQPIKHGKWDFQGYQLFRCTNCKKIYTQEQLEDIGENWAFPNFCPNCGTKMSNE